MGGVRWRMFTLALQLLLLLLLLPGGGAIPDKCAACQAVAAELELGLLNERPRNHIDLRHRLDSKGQREGKVIDYKVSELRVVELLDGLCSRMKDYALEEAGPDRGKWTKTALAETIQDRSQADAYSKQMTTFCGRLLEETEDELEEKIKNGSMMLGEVEKVLCWELTGECNSFRSSKEVEKESSREDEL